LHGCIRKNTAGDTQAIHTDEWPACRSIADKYTEHKTVKHRDKKHVAEGNVRTNSIESIWSLLKRSIIGSYHQVSAKHLDTC